MCVSEDSFDEIQWHSHQSRNWVAVTMVCVSGQYWFNQSVCVIIIWASIPRFWSQYLHPREPSYTDLLFPRWVAAFCESWLEKSSSYRKKTSSQNLNFGRTRNSGPSKRLWYTVSVHWTVQIIGHVWFDFCKMMMIVFITFKSSLVPLFEGLWSSNSWEFELSGFSRNRTDDLVIDSPSLWPTEPRLHVRS